MIELKIIPKWNAIKNIQLMKKKRSSFSFGKIEIIKIFCGAAQIIYCGDSHPTESYLDNIISYFFWDSRTTKIRNSILLKPL